MALKKGEDAQLNQDSFDFIQAPQAALRAVHVSPNEVARELGLSIYENMRVPERSVIHRVFTERSSYDEAVEDLSWWETSRGQSLKPASVRVKAKWWLDGVDALIIPG
jgi:hypothetical protein